MGFRVNTFSNKSGFFQESHLKIVNRNLTAIQFYFKKYLVERTEILLDKKVFLDKRDFFFSKENAWDTEDKKSNRIN